MRFKNVIAGLSGLLMAASLAAQVPADDTPASSIPPVQAPSEPPVPPVAEDAPAPAAPVASIVTPALSASTTPAIVMPPLEPENTLNLDLSSGGRVVIQLRPDLAPQHVERIRTLARRGFYNGLTFHRVIDGFMAQGGDPKGDGTGGSELPDVPAEFNKLPHVRGVISAARASDPNSANSQFFIMLNARLSLDGKYSGFGRVVSGMQYADAIEKGEPPANPTRILRASIGSDNVPPPPPGAMMSPAGESMPLPGPQTAPEASAPQPGTTPQR